MLCNFTKKQQILYKNFKKKSQFSQNSHLQYSQVSVSSAPQTSGRKQTNATSAVKYDIFSYKNLIINQIRQIDFKISKYKHINVYIY